MKVFILALFATFIIIACHRKSTPQMSDRTQFPTAPVTEHVLVSAEDISAGQLVYSGKKCTRCHEAKPVANWTVSEWQPILKAMIPRARLDSNERRQIAVYVLQNAKK
jgi:hypothetical protein